MENNSKKGILTSYIIVNIFCILFILTHLSLNGFSFKLPIKEIYKLFSDAFFIPGALLLLFTALIALSNQGSLDSIGYMLKRFGQMILPFTKKTNEKYADYVANKKRTKGYGFLGWIGLVYFIIGIIFTVLFYI